MKIANKFKYLYLIAGCALATTAGAVGRLADVTVYDRTENRVLPIHTHNGSYYVVGNPGNEYQIRVQNRARRDVLSVVSVDGVNVVSGETANWNQTGYVLGAQQGFDIRGWRKSLNRIAAFFFTDHSNSYAARTGRPGNVGVIGVALFRSKFVPPFTPRPPVRPLPGEQTPFPSSRGGMANDTERSADASDEPASPAQEGAASGATRDQVAAQSAILRAPKPSTWLGTGHGRSEYSRVTYTRFERESPSPAEVITIRYDTRENLLAMGVIRDAPSYARPAPMPFPGQFVPDPQ